MDHNSNINRNQNLSMENRKKLSISAIEHITSFDTEVIELISSLGNITIKGHDLDIKKLNLDDGNICITGLVDSIVYTDKTDIAQKSKGFLGKIFK